MVGVCVPLAHRVPLVRVIDVAQLIVHDDGFDLAGLAGRGTDPAEVPEPAHERPLHAARAVGVEAILPEVVRGTAELRRDDRKHRAV